MNTGYQKTILTALTVGSLMLAACDERDSGDDGASSATEAGETEAGETEAGETEVGETEVGETEATACEGLGDSQACTTEEGAEGTQFCDAMAWGPCLTQIDCTPGETEACPCEGADAIACGAYRSCNLYDGVPDWDDNQSFDAGCNTPLVLSFDGRPAELSPAGAATFDLDGIGGCITTDWPEASTPWLALDRDSNGAIDSGRELFGSGTRLRDGTRAAHGFDALRELDDDGNGIIDVRDVGFSKLVLWGDHDSDRRSTFAETEELSQRQVLSIELDYRIERQCDERGNCGVERASFTFVEHGELRRGEVVDLHLACQ